MNIGSHRDSYTRESLTICESCNKQRWIKDGEKDCDECLGKTPVQLALQHSRDAWMMLLRPDARNGVGELLEWSPGMLRFMRERVAELNGALGCVDDLKPLFNGDGHE